MILTFSGWNQPAEFLNHIVPAAQPFDYHSLGSLAECEAALASHTDKTDVVAGWSLGAYVALYAVCQGWLKPRSLLLIAPPFHYVSSAKYQNGTAEEDLRKFSASYHRDPIVAMRDFSALMAQGDRREKELRRLFQEELPRRLAPNALDWLKVLEESDVSSLPALPQGVELTIIHGQADKVTPAEQAAYFRKAYPKARVEVWEGCAHAPQWHDPVRLASYLVSADSGRAAVA